VDQDPDPGRQTLFPIKRKSKKMHVKEHFMGWRFLLEPKGPLKGFKKTYITVVFIKKAPNYNIFDNLTAWIRIQ
jgi:hypothetical protein